MMIDEEGPRVLLTRVALFAVIRPEDESQESQYVDAREMLEGNFELQLTFDIEGEEEVMSRTLGSDNLRSAIWEAQAEMAYMGIPVEFFPKFG